ncbi:MAG: glycosyltransferase family 2 protein [Akkermansia sp.]|nr:glycosyltransferase family 2 protein [Akkermansia sp.]
MSEHPKVSVIVPIYKVEKYLRQCVDSIIAQTLDDIEIILVDDGSPDACPAMVDAYAAQDPRVVAIHQPNGGYGKAVNIGIAAARAPYIGIVESDDWIEPDMYEKLYKRAIDAKADVVKCMFWKYNSCVRGKKRNVLYTEPVADLRDAPDAVFKATEWEPILIHMPSIWSCLYETELLRAVPFIETAGATYQDLPFMMEILACARRISIVKEPLLHYRVEPDQNSSGCAVGKQAMATLDMSCLANEVMQRYHLLPKHKEAWGFHLFNANIWAYVRILPQYKEKFCAGFRLQLRPFFQDASFTWKYFSPAERCVALRIVAETPSEKEWVAHQENLARDKANAEYPNLLRRYRLAKLKTFFSWGKSRAVKQRQTKMLHEQVRACRALMKKHYY